MKLENIQPARPTTLEPTPAPKGHKQEVLLTHTAIGMYKIPQQGSESTRYVVIEVEYDPVTGKTGPAKEVLRDNREDAIEKFKVKASDFFRAD